MRTHEYMASEIEFGLYQKDWFQSQMDLASVINYMNVEEPVKVSFTI